MRHASCAPSKQLGLEEVVEAQRFAPASQGEHPSGTARYVQRESALLTTTSTIHGSTPLKNESLSVGIMKFPWKNENVQKKTNQIEYGS